MLPIIDMNVIDCYDGDYVRSDRNHIRPVEDELTRMYGGWRTFLCNSGQEAAATLLDILQPNTVIVDSGTYFEIYDWLCYKGANIIQLSNVGKLSDLTEALVYAKGVTLVIISNPTILAKWYDVSTLASVVHEYGGILAVDNSIVSLCYSNPIKNGADVCIESYTKYVCGYGDTMVGGLCFSNSMQFLEQKTLQIEDIMSLRGNCVSPEKAYMVSRGLQTLACRMATHTNGAGYICSKFKEAGVEYLWSGCGGVIVLPNKSKDICKKLKLFKTAETFGCTYSIADFFKGKECYTLRLYVRLSIGLENPHDLWEDIKQALDLG